MLNKVILMGRLTSEPELRYTPSQIAVTNFTVAVDRNVTKSGAEKKTDFIECTAWRQQAEFVQKYFHKGQMAVVEGAIQVETYKANDGTNRKKVTVVTEKVFFGESKAKSQEQTQQPVNVDVSVPVPPHAAYQQPVYQQPIYQQPVYQQPVYQQPVPQPISTGFTPIESEGDLPF